MLRKLYVVPIGGLANRMRAIASGVSLARRVERTPIIVWHPDSGLNASFSDIFQTNGLPFELEQPGYFKFNTIFEIPRKRNFYVSALTPFFDGRKRIFQDVNSNFISDDREIERMVSGYRNDIIITSGLVFAPIDRDLVNSMFQISSDVKDRIKEIKGNFNPDSALHIRRTDNYHSINNSPLEAFVKITDRLIKQNSNIHIFLATDDEKTKLYFQEHYPGNVFYNPTKATRNSRSGIIDAAAELYLMSDCREIFGSYWSSYSEIAALIGGRKLKIVKS